MYVITIKKYNWNIKKENKYDKKYCQQNLN